MAGRIIIGVDGGGTKTECAALSLDDGRCYAVSGGGTNYQGCGIKRARDEWGRLIDTALDGLGEAGVAVAAAGLGIAGLDRPKDDAVIRSEFEQLLPGVPLDLVNDAYLALRAGTDDGVGVGVVSGTGCNAMGANSQGKRFRVGGHGPEFGDLGSASDIGVQALRRTFRSQDGRGPETALVELLLTRLKLARLDDIVDYFLADNRAKGHGKYIDSFNPGMLAPLVFEAAAGGDGVSISILEWAGSELGLSVLAVARQLFAADEPFPLVMGGSVLQKGATTHVRESLLAHVRREFPLGFPVALDLRPVAGGVLYAMDLVSAAGLEADYPGLGRVVREEFAL